MTTLKLTSEQVLALAKTVLRADLETVSPIEWEFAVGSICPPYHVGTEMYGDVLAINLRVTTFAWGYSPKTGFVKLLDGEAINNSRYTHVVMGRYRYRFRNSNDVNTADGCVTVYEL